MLLFGISYQDLMPASFVSAQFVINKFFNTGKCFFVVSQLYDKLHTCLIGFEREQENESTD